MVLTVPINDLSQNMMQVRKVSNL